MIQFLIFIICIAGFVAIVRFAVPLLLKWGFVGVVAPFGFLASVCSSFKKGNRMYKWRWFGLATVLLLVLDIYLYFQ